MTIQSTDRKAGPFLSGTALPFEFKVFSKEDIAVIYTNAEGVEVVLVLDSDYSVTLNADQDNNPGGTATLTTPIVSGDRANIIGDLGYDQGTDIRNQGGFEPEIIEDALDRATIQIQQLKEISDRTLKTAPGDSRTGDELLADIFEAEENAATSAAAAEESANRVDLGALDDAVAQTQADVVTTTTQAGIATTQAGIATAQAVISAENADLTAADVMATEAAQTQAAAAAVASLAAANTFTSTAAGIAATANGDVFLVNTGDPQIYDVYSNNAGVAASIGILNIQEEILAYGETGVKTTLLAAARGLVLGVPPSENGLLYKAVFRFETGGTIRINRLRLSGGNYLRDGFDTVIVPGAGLYTHIFADPIEIGSDFYLALDVPANMIRSDAGSRDQTFLSQFYLDADGVIPNAPLSTAVYPISYYVVSKSAYKYYKALKDTADALRVDFDEYVVSNNEFVADLPTQSEAAGFGTHARPATPQIESTIEDGSYSLIVESMVPMFAPVLTSHINTTTGNDTNPGTRALPKQTIPTIASGSDYGFEGGDLIDQSVNITASNGSALVGYRGFPTFDGAGPVLETWFQNDAITYPNTWEIDVTHGFALTSGRLMIWEDGVLLKRVTSIALVDAEAGTYYSPNDNNFTIPVVKVYVRTTDTANPNTNGKLYERTQRTYVINGGFGTAQNQTVSKVVAGRQGNNDGSIVLGKNSYLDRVLCFDGHKHNALQESGICQNSAFINAQPESNYLHVFYTPDAAGLSTEIRNSVFVGQENGLLGTAALYSHDNAGVAYDNSLIESVTCVNVNSAISSACDVLDAQGVYVEKSNTPWTNITGSITNFSHFLVKDQLGGSNFNGLGTHTMSQIAAYVPNANFLRPSTANFGDMVLKQSTIHMDPGAVTGARWICRRVGAAANGTFSANRNIFIIDGTISSLTTVVDLTTATTGSIDNNVYFVRGDFPKSALRWTVNGVNNTFAQWQALGYDLNSLVLDETDILFEDLFVSSPMMGDFRLRSGLSFTLPDMTPISELGVTERWDFNAQKVMQGAPNRWVNAPKTRAQGLEFVTNPDGWAF